METRNVAYLAALGAAIPSFTGVDKICPQLEGVVGGGDYWDSGEGWDQFEQLMSVDSIEARAAFDAVKEEYRVSSMYLGREMEGVISEGFAAIEEEGYRSRVVEQRDVTRHLLLNKALQLYPDQEARPVWSWPELDKCSSQYLACLPGSETSFTSAEFCEAVAAHLSVPSPACSTRLGEKVKGRQVVDSFGDTVISAQMCGDGWRTRHTMMEKLIVKKCRWAGVPVQCEVFNLFARDIPQEGLSRIERGRKRKGLVPDFKFPGWGGVFFG